MPVEESTVNHSTFVCCECGSTDAVYSDTDLGLCEACSTLFLEASEWNDERTEEILDGIRQRHG